MISQRPFQRAENPFDGQNWMQFLMIFSPKNIPPFSILAVEMDDCSNSYISAPHPFLISELITLPRWLPKHENSIPKRIFSSLIWAPLHSLHHLMRLCCWHPFIILQVNRSASTPSIHSKPYSNPMGAFIWPIGICSNRNGIIPIAMNIMILW